MLTEDQECKNLVKYLEILKEAWKIKEFSHLAQNTYTPFHWVRNKNKQMGVRKWVPDYMIIINEGNSVFGKQILLFLEMKRLKGWRASKEQVKRLKELNKVPWVVGHISRWFFEAKQILQNYIE